MSHRLLRPFIVFLFAYFLLLFGLDGFGLVSVDEPRYAWIGREMAWSGDWITPRLWGEAWFEKPVLLYWMIGAATQLGLRDELAARLPVALLSLAFLYAYRRVLGREFGREAGWCATAMLATSAGWVGFSHAAVTDLPLAVTFGAAMLAVIPWIGRGDTRGLTAAGAFLGLAALAKGLVPLVLAFPAIWIGRRQWRDLWRPAAAFALVALPWNIACWWINGRPFLAELYWRHHVERLVSESIQHVQAWWFFLPVLLAGMFPWTPLVGLVYWRKAAEDPRLRLFALWAGFGFVFFSLATNKLPGYVLPLMPAIFALIGVRAATADTKARWLPVVGVLLGLIPVVGVVLPKALADGISSVQLAELPWGYAGIGFVLSIGLRWAQARGWKHGIITGLAAGAAVGVVYLKAATLPAIDREASARPTWRSIEREKDQVCLQDAGRQLVYGLNYYSLSSLPDCLDSPRPIRVTPNGVER